jgi:hypothetical protein
LTQKSVFIGKKGKKLRLFSNKRGEFESSESSLSRLKMWKIIQEKEDKKGQKIQKEHKKTAEAKAMQVMWIEAINLQKM